MRFTAPAPAPSRGRVPIRACAAQCRLVFFAALFLFVPLSPTGASTAEAQDARVEELRRKERELEQLRKDLGAAETEIRRLKNELAVATNAAPARLAPAVPPARPITNLPPLKPRELVAASELTQHFSGDPEGARRRYANQIVRVRGPINRLSPQAFRRKYNIIVGTQADPLTIQCQFDYPSDYKTVYVRNNDEILTALTTSERVVNLARLGETVIIEGRCAGRQGNRLILERCKLIRAQP